jgi:diketogulonate reductase-like aldo/keto reductase
MPDIPTLPIPNHIPAPVFGQGTWKVGDVKANRAAEIAALHEGVSLGMTLIDTAEMYGEGAAETLIGEAFTGRRQEIFLVSKAYPQNASRRRLATSCDASLRRLRTDHLDLYLLHWRGDIPLAETVEAMEALQRAGKIRAWGVSNFDVADMEDLLAAGGHGCAANQILYNVARRGPEHDLLPWLAEHRIPAMAYSPVEQGRLIGHPALAAIAARRGLAPLQVALAWVVRQPNLITIVKSGNEAHVRQNRAAFDVKLTSEDLTELESAFPAPKKKKPLEMI